MSGEDQRLACIEALTRAALLARSVEEVAATVLREGLDAAAATGGLVLLRDAEAPERDLRIVADQGYAEEAIGRWRRVPIAVATPLTTPLRNGDPEWIKSPEDFNARFPGMPTGEGSGHLAWAFVPLLVEGRVDGALGLSFGDPRPDGFPPAERRFLEMLGRQAAVALSLVRAREAAEQAVRFSELFIGILGHDLRNPLSAITTGAEAVLRRSQDSRVISIERRVLSSARRMSRMIDQLLDFTRVRLGEGLPLAPREANLGVLCESCVEELRHANPTAVVHLERLGDTAGRWDTDRLEQLVSNLVGNAVRHGTPGLPVEVQVDGRDPAAVRLEVKNHGHIPANLVPGLFEPLRPGLVRRSGSSGLGLGLYISKEVAVAHGGRIEVRSTLDEGTAFLVELPRSSSATARSWPPPAT